jgi:uncharacterized membrane protein
MRHRRLLFVTLLFAALVLAGPRIAQARPDFGSVVEKTYPEHATAFTQRGCAACHVSDSDFTRNGFGIQLAAAMKAANAKKPTPEILHQLDAQDADGDGAANLAEIEGGTNPADAKSAPAAGASAPAPKAAAPAAPAEPEKKSWFPKEAFHPAIVHFPIALFIAGLVLDLFGLILRNKTLLFAGWYNLVLAALGTFGAIATGWLALVLLKVPVAGLIQQHIIMGALTTAVMWAMVALRVHRHEKTNGAIRVVYYLLAVAGFILVGYTGHLGGAFVYGE